MNARESVFRVNAWMEGPSDPISRSGQRISNVTYVELSTCKSLNNSEPSKKKEEQESLVLFFPPPPRSGQAEPQPNPSLPRPYPLRPPSFRWVLFLTLTWVLNVASPHEWLQNCWYDHWTTDPILTESGLTSSPTSASPSSEPPPIVLQISVAALNFAEPNSDHLNSDHFFT